MRRSLSGNSGVASMLNNAGERMAESPARITICPMAYGTSPRASAANGGPTGAPGQTARMRNPIETIGLASNRYSIDERQGNHMKLEIPGGVPGILPLV